MIKKKTKNAYLNFGWFEKTIVWIGYPAPRRWWYRSGSIGTRSHRCRSCPGSLSFFFSNRQNTKILPTPGQEFNNIMSIAPWKYVKHKSGRVRVDVSPCILYSVVRQYITAPRTMLFLLFTNACYSTLFMLALRIARVSTSLYMMTTGIRFYINYFNIISALKYSLTRLLLSKEK